MFPNLLSTSPWIWAGVASSLIALPILIHLINMLRHRRVKWAAMDFLLQSYQRNRNWIWLKQLILLLTRIAALLLILLMIAQVGCRNDELAGLEGSNPTHHYILVDDSFSMSERDVGQLVFDRAKETVQLLVARAGRRQDQRITLVRYSQAQFAAGDANQSNSGSPSSDTLASNSQGAFDIDGVEIDSSVGVLLDDQLSAVDTTDLAVGPDSGLELIEQRVRSNPSEQAIIYIVSDYRAKDWDDPTSVLQTLERIRKAGGQVHLINCLRQSGTNLAIVGLEPVSGMTLADVPMFVRITVRNLSGDAVDNVQVRLEQSLFPSRDTSRNEPGQWEPTVEELPTAFFEKIDKGSTATQEVPVFFSSEGRHVLTATLEDDDLAVDNSRYCVVDCKATANILLVDDGAAENAYFLQLAFQPGRRSTGIQSSVLSTAELERLTPTELQEYDSIVLADPIRFNQSTVERLAEFVTQGGGLAVYAGPESDIAFMNSSLYRQGEYLLPMPIDEATMLPELIDDSGADIIPTDHPLFRAFSQSRNSPLSLVTLKSYMRPPSGWTPDDDSSTEILARVRSEEGEPLILTKPFGQGRVTLVNTSCAPIWHDWTANPSFVVCSLLLQEQLMRKRHPDLNRQVATQFKLSLNRDEYRDTIRVVRANEARETIELSSSSEDDGSNRFMFEFGSASANSPSIQTSDFGVYEVWLEKQTEEPEVIRWATSLDEDEGQLEPVARDVMLRKLASAKPKLEFWDEITSDARRDLSPSLAKWLIGIVIFVLLAEQLLAYLTSYHPARREVRA